jgi:hypothetical protein
MFRIRSASYLSIAIDLYLLRNTTSYHERGLTLLPLVDHRLMNVRVFCEEILLALDPNTKKLTREFPSSSYYIRAAAVMCFAFDEINIQRLQLRLVRYNRK